MKSNMPDELKRLDQALARMADRAREGLEPGGEFERELLKRIRGRSPDARIIKLDGEDSPNRRGGRLKKPVLVITIAALAACLVGVVGFRALLSDPPGMMEFRTGLATIVRSGRAVPPSTVCGLRSGDLLETREGKLVAYFDNRTQLLMNRDSKVRIEGKNAVNLQSGEVWIYVTPGSGDYSVTVPGGSVHVVGTSFGVQVTGEGVGVKVTNGKVLYRVGGEDAGIGACEHLFLPRGGNLAEATVTEDKELTRPPLWVESLINKMAEERLRKFFPSAVPIENAK